MSNIFLVEDHAFSRDGLRVAIERHQGLHVIGEARSGEEALEMLEDIKADVVVLDIGLPGMDGIETCRRIKQQFADTRVVMLTAHRLENQVLAALASGAEGYCLKSTDPAGVILAIQSAILGSAYLDPQIAHVVLGKINLPSPEGSVLSPRELEVLGLIAKGLSNKEIADQLEISLSTVKTHIEDILKRLKVSDRTQAAVIAVRQGLV